MDSWIKNMKDSSRRLKTELMNSIGVGSDGAIDPVLEHRAQRFNQYNDSLDKLSKAMSHYIETSQAHANASVGLMHAFSGFFEVQLSEKNLDDEDYPSTKSLAQSALRLEEIHQSLRADIYQSTHEVQMNTVLRSIQNLKRNNAGLQKQIQSLKQKLIDYDSTRRAAESQKKSTPEFEKAQQKVAAAEAALVSLSTVINSEMDAIEARRSTDMRNELLTVAACQIFIHSRATEHLQQMIPLIPGISKPMIYVTEHSRQRPAWNPTEKDTMGVIRYCGKESVGTIDTPIQYHEKLPQLEVTTVNPIQSMQFGDIHFGEKLALATYGRQ